MPTGDMYNGASDQHQYVRLDNINTCDSTLPDRMPCCLVFFMHRSRHDAPGAGECHIETPGVAEKPNALVLIGPHARQNHKVLLTPLERIDRGNFHRLIQRPEEGSTARHNTHHMRPLALVGRDDANLLWADAMSKHVRDKLLHRTGLGPA